MRVLVIWHAAVVESYRQRFIQVGQNKDIEIHILAPKWWPEAGRNVRLQKFRTERNTYPARTILTGRGSTYFYPSLLKYLLRVKPDVIHVEEEPWSFCTYQALLFRNIFLPKTKVVGLSSENTYRVFKFLRNTKFPLHSYFEAYCNRYADYIIVRNEDGKRILLRKGFSEKKVKVVPQHVDTELFRPLDASALRRNLSFNSTFVIGCVGRFVQEKGIVTLLESASMLEHDYQLMLVGSGPYRVEIDRRAKKLGIMRRIVHVDPVPHSDMPHYMNCMDVLVLPSLTTPGWKEIFGRVLIEAMACEVSVIGSDSGEIPNVIGEAGLIFKERDAEDLKRKLEMLIGGYACRRELALRGRQRVLENYSASVIAAKLYEIYRRLMNL